MDQPNDLPCRPDPKVLISGQKYLPPPLPAHVRRDLLKFPCRALLLYLRSLLRNLVLKQP